MLYSRNNPNDNAPEIPLRNPAYNGPDGIFAEYGESPQFDEIGDSAIEDEDSDVY